ncbi:putative RING-H2 finger protein ATL69 [Oryza brachyantha]|uniref:putative RING-H2 finger protein ATL69 n=1 Tax=Oryza brachyantha TaxID=4533 RepID=UPI001ADAF361|nr:putative RING-H2 finger protein ATL69 [Oryza brachyantha]
MQVDVAPQFSEIPAIRFLGGCRLMLCQVKNSTRETVGTGGCCHGPIKLIRVRHVVYFSVASSDANNVPSRLSSSDSLVPLTDQLLQPATQPPHPGGLPFAARAEMRASVTFAPASSPGASLPPPGAAGVGGAVCLGYGIAISVGVLVFISTVMLASYICVRAKAGAAAVLVLVSEDGAAPSAPPAAVVVLGLDGPAIDALYPKFQHVGDTCAAGAVACAICLGEFAAGDALRRGPGCGHRFHAECAERWLRVSATCPVCRDSPLPSPMATPLAEAVPLAAHAR